ncbi:MAG: hypothetical protein GPJ54_20745 [Candidatus Heimdallarchaeota archaeon]|nr:hypothetical protein [Candidatus Heimdallarchaeota archaeon]
MQLESKGNVMGNILLILIILISTFRLTSESAIIPTMGAILAIFATILYTKRILAISHEVRTPLSDTLITLSGINVALFLFYPLTQLSFLLNFSYGNSLVLLAVGAVFKLLLLDQAIIELWHQITNAIHYLIDWSSSKFINFIRLLLTVLSLILFTYQTEIDLLVNNHYSFSLSLVLISLVIFLSSFNSWGGKYRGIRFAVFMATLFLIGRIGLLPLIQDKVSLLILILSIMVWSISLPYLRKISTDTARRVWYTIKSVYFLILEHKKTIFHILAFISSIIALEFVSVTPIIGLIPLNVLSFTILLFLGIYPIILNLLKSISVALKDLFKDIIYLLKQFVGWIGENYILFSRILTMFASLILLISHGFSPQIYKIIIALTLIIYSIFPLISSLVNWIWKTLSTFFSNTIQILSFYGNWVINNKFLFSRYLSIVYALIALIINIFSPSEYYPPVIFILLLYSISPPVYNFIQISYRFIIENPKASLQGLSFLLGIVAIFIIPTDKIFGIQVNFAVSGFFFIMSVSPWISRLISSIYHISKNILQYLYGKFNSIDKILPVFAVILIILPKNSDIKLYPSIAIYVLATILLALSWNQLLMRIIDSLVFGVVSIAYSILNLLFSFFRFLYHLGFFGWLKRRLTNLFSSIYRNLILLALWGVAIVFVLLGVGVIFPGIFSLSQLIFSAIIDEKLISFIIGVFLIAIGILTFKEVFARRSKLRKLMR